MKTHLSNRITIRTPGRVVLPGVVLLGVVLLGLAGMAHAEGGDGPRAVTGTVFFGSSTQGTGNLYLILPLPQPPYDGGRISNGPVWADYFADSTGTEAVASFLGGTNYSLGGARTGEVNYGLPPITSQVGDYLESVGFAADRQALYLLQTAANDLTAAKQLPPEEARQTMLDAVALTGSMVNDLMNAGARNFVLFTIPELPTAPVSPILPDGTNLAALTSDGLAALVDSYRRSGTHVTLFDLHGLVADVVANPGAFGFDVTGCSFMGRGSLEILAGNTTPDPCEPAVPVERYMMLDDEHYTTRMHEVIAREVFAQLCSVPAPLPHVRAVCATRWAQGLR